MQTNVNLKMVYEILAAILEHIYRSYNKRFIFSVYNIWQK